MNTTPLFRIFQLLALTGLLLLAAPATFVHAQGARKISFNEAVQIALERNVTIRRSRNTVDLQSVNVARERADFYPNLNLSSNSTRNYGLSFDQTTGRTFSSTSDNVSLSANSSVNIFNGYADVASLNQAKHTLESNEYTHDRTRQTVLFNVISNYLQVILDHEQIRIRKEDLEAQNQQLTRIEEFTRVGARPVSDLYQQQATVANSELQLLEARRQAQLSQIRLIQVLQLDPFQDYEFTAPAADEIDLTPQVYDPEQLLRSAFDSRPDLRAQEASIAASSEGIRFAKAGRLPTLSLSGGIGSRFSSQLRRATTFDMVTDPVTGETSSVPTAFGTVPFGDQFRDNRAENVGINIQIPIFNRLQTKTGIERARVQYENARLDLENLQLTVAAEVRQAFLDYQTAEKRLDVTDKQLRAAQQALDVEQERYNVGASTLVELTQARSSYVQASSNRVQAVYQFHFQQRLVEYYQGVIDPSKPLFR